MGIDSPSITPFHRMINLNIIQQKLLALIDDRQDYWQWASSALNPIDASTEEEDIYEIKKPFGPQLTLQNNINIVSKHRNI
jgi:hypothetical protein